MGNTRFLEVNDQQPVVKYETLSLDYFLDVYYLLMIGIFSSILCLILEFIYEYLKGFFDFIFGIYFYLFDLKF